MDIVLGVSITTTAVRFALVDGNSADGAALDHDVLLPADGGFACEQLMSAVMGTQGIATAGGHRLRAVGVTYVPDMQSLAEEFRSALDSMGLESVVLAGELQAAEVLAQAVGRTLGYCNTGVISIRPDTATVGVVPGGSSRVLTALLDDARPAQSRAALVRLVNLLDGHPAAPDGIYLVGADVDLIGVAECLRAEVSLPVTTPAEPELALARGAALLAGSQCNSDAGAQPTEPRPASLPTLFVPRAPSPAGQEPAVEPIRPQPRHRVETLTATLVAAAALLVGSVALALGMNVADTGQSTPTATSGVAEVAPKTNMSATDPDPLTTAPPQLPPPAAVRPLAVPAATDPPAAGRPARPLPRPVVEAVRKMQKPVTIPEVPGVLDHSMTVRPLPVLLDGIKAVRGH